MRFTSYCTSNVFNKVWTSSIYDGMQAYLSIKTTLNPIWRRKGLLTIRLLQCAILNVGLCQLQKHIKSLSSTYNFKLERNVKTKMKKINNNE